MLLDKVTIKKHRCWFFKHSAVRSHLAMALGIEDCVNSMVDNYDNHGCTKEPAPVSEISSLGCLPIVLIYHWFHMDLSICRFMPK